MGPEAWSTPWEGGELPAHGQDTDGTGIPLDDDALRASTELREIPDRDHFAAAANSQR